MAGNTGHRANINALRRIDSQQLQACTSPLNDGCKYVCPVINAEPVKQPPYGMPQCLFRLLYLERFLEELARQLFYLVDEEGRKSQACQIAGPDAAFRARNCVRDGSPVFSVY